MFAFPTLQLQHIWRFFADMQTNSLANNIINQVDKMAQAPVMLIRKAFVYFISELPIYHRAISDLVVYHAHTNGLHR